MSEKIETNFPLVQKTQTQSQSTGIQVCALKGIFQILSKNRERGIEKQSATLEGMMTRYDAVNFLLKFDRQKEGKENYFDVGERVAASFVIVDVYNEDRTLDQTKIGLLVERIDTRLADTFVIDVASEEYRQCQQYKGMEFNGVVEVTGEGRYIVSNMYEYPAKCIQLEFNLPINPETTEEFDYGDRVTIEGKIVDFRIVEYWGFTSSNEDSPSPKKAIITIETNDGKNMCVQIDPSVKLEQSSALENIKGKVPEVGDVVRINAIVRKNDIENPDLEAIGSSPLVRDYYSQIKLEEQKIEGDRIAIDADIASTRQALALTRDEAARSEVGAELQKLNSKKEKKGVKVLSADWCRSTYLIEPNQKRKEQYEDLRQEVDALMEDLIEKLEQGSFGEARQILTQLIKKEVTVEERKTLNELVESMTESERPLMHWERYEADEINKLFDTDVDVMTLDEFYAFVKNCVQTPYALMKSSGRGDHSYLFRIMDDIGMPQEQQEELMSLSIDVRWKYFQELKQRGEKYDHDRDWSDKFMLEQSLVYLSSVRTPSSLQKLINVTYDIVMAEDVTAEIRGKFIYKAKESLNHASHDAKGNPELLEVFDRNAQKIKEMESELRKYNM